MAIPEELVRRSEARQDLGPDPVFAYRPNWWGIGTFLVVLGLLGMVGACSYTFFGRG